MPNDLPTTLRYWRVWALPMLVLTITASWLGMIIWAIFPISQGGRIAAVIISPFFVVAAGAVLRTPFLRLTIGPNGVCAHNFVRNRSVAWDDFLGVTVVTAVGGRGGLFYLPAVRTASGQDVPVRGLSSYSYDVVESFASRISWSAPSGRARVS